MRTIFALILLLLNTHSASAGPYPKNEQHDFGFGYLMPRGCDSYCGYNDQYCCSAGETCHTNAMTIAQCLTAAPASPTPANGWEVIVTVHTRTDFIVETVTTSIFTGVPAATTPASNPETTIACQYAAGQTVCGAICCSSTQYCAKAGQCVAVGGATPFSAPVLPTNGAHTITKTATATRPFETPFYTGSGSSIGVTSGSQHSNGLSGGQIAGIVIGVIAAISLLVLLCFCLIVRSGFEAFGALFGRGRNRNRRTEEVITTEERYSRRNAGVAAGRAEAQRTWWGASRPRRTTIVSEKRQSSFGNLAWIGTFLVALAVCLGLKRRHDRVDVRKEVRKEVKKEVREREPVRVDRSDLSSDYYSDYYTATTESTVSDDRRTRTTMHHTPRR